MHSVATRFALAGVVSVAMTTQAVGQDLQQKVAAAKQAAAQNQQALRGYTWLEKVELLYKGELKSTKVSACRYGPDGQVQKTPVVEPPEAEKKRGVRGKIVEKKTGEMKAELEAAAALAHQYVPPSPARIQAVMDSGGVSVAQAGAGAASLKLANYVKAGDTLALTFEQASKALKRIDVNTWLDTPSEPVTLQVAMQSLPEGPHYPGQIALTIPSSQVEVRITNSNYQKLAP